LTASPSQGSAPLTVGFTAAAFDTKGAISMYEFDFGDGIVRQKSAYATHRYINNGTYNASVRALDSQNRWVSGIDCQKTIKVASNLAVLGATAPPMTMPTSTPLPAKVLPSTGVSDWVPVTITIAAVGGYILFKRSAGDIHL